LIILEPPAGKKGARGKMSSSPGMQIKSNGGSLEPAASSAASSAATSNGTGAVTSGTSAVDTKANKEAAKQQQPEIVQTMSTSALEAKLRQLRQESQEHSQILTQKLASSQSGQNLLHIGTSLSTLPPDLHNLLTQLHPVLSTVEGVERNHIVALQALVQQATAVRAAGRRVHTAADAADLYADFCAAEKSVQRETVRQSGGGGSGGYFNGKNDKSRRFSSQQQNDDDENIDYYNDDDFNEDGDILGT
jgi:hypothetical protein